MIYEIEWVVRARKKLSLHKIFDLQAKNSIFESDNFGKFFSENNARFVDIAFSYVRDMAAAQDIVMDSFVYIWQRREELTNQNNMRGYAYMCVRNRCYSYLRQIDVRGQLGQTDRQLVHSSLESLSRNEIFDKLLGDEVAEIFRSELDKMPARTREIFLASRIEHLTYAEIAERFDIPVRRVTSEIQSALQVLRHALKDYLPLILFLLGK